MRFFKEHISKSVGAFRERPRITELFQPIDHSNPTVEWFPTSSEESAEVAGIARTRYGIDPVLSVERVGRRDVSSNNFKVSGMYAGAETSIVLKRHVLLKHNPSAVETIEDVYGYLAYEGIPSQEVITPTNPRAERAGNIWQAFVYRNGTHFRGTEEDLASAARLIANMHGALDRLPESLKATVSTTITPFVKPWDAPVLLGRIKEAQSLARSGAATPGQEILARHARYLIRMSEQARADQHRSRHARIQMGKGTIHPHDFIFPSDGRGPLIIDVEQIGMYPLMEDVGVALHRLVREYARVADGTPQKSVRAGVQIFLDNYREVYPLSDQEIRLIPGFLRTALLSKVASVSRLDNPLYADHPDGENARSIQLSKFIRFLGEVDVVAEGIRLYIRTPR